MEERSLSAEQIRLLGYCLAYWRHYGYPPNTREIMQACQVSTESLVRRRLRDIEQIGLISLRPRSARAMNLQPAWRAYQQQDLQIDLQQWDDLLT